MKFSTFALFNTLLIFCVLLFGIRNNKELHLFCANTDVIRSSLLDGQLVYSDAQRETFTTAVKLIGDKSLQLFYPAEEPQISYTFESVKVGEGFITAQRNSAQKLLMLAIEDREGIWEGQLIELTYGDKISVSMLHKVYYCR